MCRTSALAPKDIALRYTTPEDDLYRIISARFATSAERDDYEKNLFHS